MARPTFTLNKDNESNHFSVTGDLSVQYATEFKAFLSQALEQAVNFTVNFDQANSIDSASIQITYAVKRAAALRGVLVKLSWPQNKSALDLLTKTGITKIL